MSIDPNDNKLLTQHPLSYYQDEKLFEQNVYGAPTIAGSIKAMIEGAICFAYSITQWEISHLHDLAAKKNIEVDEEFAQKALEKMSQNKSEELFQVISDPEIQESIDKLLKESVEALIKTQEKFLTASREASHRFTNGISKIKGYHALHLNDDKTNNMCLDLQSRVAQMFGISPFSENALKIVSDVLPSPAPSAYNHYLTEPTASSDAPKGDVVSAPTPKPQFGERPKMTLEEEMAPQLAKDLRKVMEKQNIPVNDPDSLELMLRMQVVQKGQVFNYIKLIDAVHEIKQRIDSIPEASKILNKRTEAPVLTRKWN